jgi:hypothetical protein
MNANPWQRGGGHQGSRLPAAPTVVEERMIANPLMTQSPHTALAHCILKEAKKNPCLTHAAVTLFILQMKSFFLAAITQAYRQASACTGFLINQHQ